MADWIFTLNEERVRFRHSASSLVHLYITGPVLGPQILFCRPEAGNGRRPKIGIERCLHCFQGIIKGFSRDFQGKSATPTLLLALLGYRGSGGIPHGGKWTGKNSVRLFCVECLPPFKQLESPASCLGPLRNSISRGRVTNHLRIYMFSGEKQREIEVLSKRAYFQLKKIRTPQDRIDTETFENIDVSYET